MSDSHAFQILRGLGRVLGVLTLLGLVAGANGPGGPGGPGNGGSAFSSDEMVGTLPSTQGWDRAMGQSLDPQAGAAFYLEGNWQRVLRAVRDASGPGYVSLEMNAQGELRAVLRGDLRLDLHPLAFHDGELRAGLQFGAEESTAAVGLFHAGRMVSKIAHDTQRSLPVPMAHLVDVGALDSGVTLATSTRLTGRTLVNLALEGGSLSIVQTR